MAPHNVVLSRIGVVCKTKCNLQISNMEEIPTRLLVILAALIVRWCVSLNSYSGKLFEVTGFAKPLLSPWNLCPRYGYTTGRFGQDPFRPEKTWTFRPNIYLIVLQRQIIIIIREWLWIRNRWSLD